MVDDPVQEFNQLQQIQLWHTSMGFEALYGNTEYRLFGYITRKSEIKVLIQSDSDIANNSAHIISGEGLRACISVLTEHLWQHRVQQTGKTDSGYGT